MRRILLISAKLILFMGIQLSSYAQQRVSGTFAKAPFGEFIESIESSTGFRFHYDPKSIDTLKVTVSPRNQTLMAVLDEVLLGTDFRYTIDSNRVYITLRHKIVTELPYGLFEDELIREDTRKENTASRLFEKSEEELKKGESRIYYVGAKTTNLQGKASISGYVKEAANGEPMIGASVYVENPLIGVATDQFGYFLITLPKGRHSLKVKSIGMKTLTRQVMLFADGKIDIELDQDITPLKEVVVESERDVRISGLQMGAEKLDIKTMKLIPLALGETDILKALLTLPGVQTVGEGTVGLNVRGGASNQNLILFNDATIYNPSHLFGFFSTFNPDVLKSAELYKSGITADYGGRLSSVLDITSREGNLKKISVSGGISPITGRIVVDGPIVKDRTSFLFGIRSTYSDWLLHQLDSKKFSNSNASFYDMNFGLSHKIDDKNNLYLSAYMSKDNFKLNSDTLYSYGDQNITAKWKHQFSNKLNGVLTTGYSKYGFAVSSDKNPVNAFQLDFAVQQINAKTDFNYILNSRHALNAGLSTIRYLISPGNFQAKGAASIAQPDIMPDEQAQETAVYIGDNFEINPRLSVYMGVRYSFYQYLGPRDIYTYAPGSSKDVTTITDTTHYGAGMPIVNYGGAEPRLSMRYFASPNTSLKASYNVTRQYIQMLSNTTAITPVDLWKLSDPYLKPQVGTQISAGVYHNFKKQPLELSVETYYKTMQNLLDYKPAATYLLNRHVETDVIHATGMAYGVEFMIKKTSGRLNGWMSYTYSRSFLQAKNEFATETVNNGKYYPSNYDKPNAVNLVGNYKFSRRLSFSTNMTYSTGRPITVPLAVYDLSGSQRPYYSDRNQYRIPDYFRLDISFNIEGNHKIKKLAHGSWTLAVYNLTGRKNAYSVYFTADSGTIKGYKLSIFAQPIPTITYNFRF